MNSLEIRYYNIVLIWHMEVNNEQRYYKESCRSFGCS